MTRLALESELSVTARLPAVAAEVGASKEVLGILKAITALEDRGWAVLPAREEAANGLVRVGLRIAGWKEGANVARRHVENQLAAHATQTRKPRSYSQSFFPKLERAAKRPARPGPAPQ
ncbi:MAG: hypothetical protein EXR72_05260 [Myxococcales bacterium]|nr:hypothetical protein [Myxococcales bacterium]